MGKAPGFHAGLRFAKDPAQEVGGLPCACRSCRAGLLAASFPPRRPSRYSFPPRCPSRHSSGPFSGGPFEEPRALQDLADCCLGNPARRSQVGARGPSRSWAPHKIPVQASRKTSISPTALQRAGFSKRRDAKTRHAPDSSNEFRPNLATRPLLQTACSLGHPTTPRAPLRQGVFLASLRSPPNGGVGPGERRRASFGCDGFAPGNSPLTSTGVTP